VGDVWGKFPIDQVIRARWWRVPFDAVPRSADHEAQVQWLFGWWERIDEWITENRPGGPSRPAAVAATLPRPGPSSPSPSSSRSPSPSGSPSASPEAGLVEDAGD